jgi:excisionase family DNA binding protein
MTAMLHRHFAVIAATRSPCFFVYFDYDPRMAPSTLTRFKADADEAKHVAHALDACEGSVRITVERRGETTEATIPADLLPTVIAFLELLARHGAVDIAPADTVIGTQDAARILNVSRPTLVQMLEEGVIPFHKAGTHRRLLLSDVTAYRDAQYERSIAAMREMAEIERELGLF